MAPAVLQVTDGQGDATGNRQDGAWHAVFLEDCSCKQKREPNEKTDNDVAGMTATPRMDYRDAGNDSSRSEQPPFERFILKETKPHRWHETDQEGNERAVHRTGEADERTDAIGPARDPPFGGFVRVGVAVGMVVFGVNVFGVCFQGRSPAWSPRARLLNTAGTTRQA